MGSTGRSGVSELEVSRTGRVQGLGAGKWGTVLFSSVPEFALYTLHRGAGLLPSAGPALGGVGQLIPLPESENMVGGKLETEPGAMFFLLVAVALEMPSSLSGSRCSGGTSWL